MINAPSEGICVEFEREKHHNSLPTFKLPTSTNIFYD